MAKPSTLPKWNANQSGPRTVTPPNGVKDDGVLPGDKLPAQWLNWVLSWGYKWAQYLDGIESEALDWTPPQTFGEIRFGTDPGVIAYAQRVRVKCGSTIYARIFATSEGLTFTVNAAWDQGATQWVADDAAVRAFRLDMSDTAGFKVRTKTAAATWADGAWTSTLTLNTVGALVTLSDITATSGDVRAAAGDVRGNTVTADTGLTVTAGGLTVSAGGANITGTLSVNGQAQFGGNDLIALGDLRPNANNTQSIGTALIALKRIFAYQYIGNVQTVAAAASITIDPAAGETVRVTLSATTINAVTISPGQPGQIIDVEVIQDGTGNRGIVGAGGPNTWTNVRMSAAYVVSTGANKRDLLSFRYDSVDGLWFERSRSMNMG